ncbi:hypothetical protein, partial [Klebsiella pneumoniae]|uniref:hypothetical protein n=1 Tax=Klebsiella pneumoniae TaxID=573 RepID=UPI0022B6825D
LYGWAAGYRLYQALDGWICVTCIHDEEVEALARTVIPQDRLADLAPTEICVDAPATGALSELLEFHFVERLAGDWLE